MEDKSDFELLLTKAVELYFKNISKTEKNFLNKNNKRKESSKKTKKD